MFILKAFLLGRGGHFRYLFIPAYPSQTHNSLSFIRALHPFKIHITNKRKSTV